MPNYDFSTLNDQDLEELSRDLLNAAFGFDLQNFKRGKDKGIDLRFASNNPNELIVQVKHYRVSGYKKLLSHLTKSELPKVARLGVGRYIIVTSVELSPQQKDEIYGSLRPYLNNTNDIIGSEDLNKYLGVYPDVEKRHFKLWFSSTAVLANIIEHAIDARSRFEIQQIREKIGVFVVNENLRLADKHLEEQKILVITGQPGIGKTTLAEILIFERAKRDFHVYFVSDINEAEKVISLDDDAKQLFYIDDFLGSNYLELHQIMGRETPLSRFLHRIKSTPNKFLLLTTRTVFLTQAISKYEKIRLSGIGEDYFELSLEAYTDLDKAKILYNHVYASNTSEEQRAALVSDQFYWTIIKHPNYTPRLIGFCCADRNIKDLDGDQFRSKMLGILENPTETWAFAFDEQIGYFERCFLFTLCSFPRWGTNEQNLRVAFDHRLSLEHSRYAQPITATQFEDSLRIVQSSFVFVTLDKVGVRRFRFLNPSIVDFLMSRLVSQPEQLDCLVASVVFESQLNFLDPEKKTFELSPGLQGYLFEKLKACEISWDVSRFSLEERSNTNIIEVLKVVVRYCPEMDTDGFIAEELACLDLYDTLEGFFTILDYIGKRTDTMRASYNYVVENFRLISIGLIEGLQYADDEDPALRLPDLFELFGQTYRLLFVGPSDDQYRVQAAVQRILEDLHQGYIIEQASEYMSIQDVVDRYERLDISYMYFEEILFPGSNLSGIPRVEMDYGYWEEVVEQNIAKEAERREKNSAVLSALPNSKSHSNEGVIDDMFASLSPNNG